MKMNLLCRVGGAALCAWSLGGGYAAAQDAPQPVQSQEEPAQVDDIIVTAQKRGERPVDIPASLTVITAEDLQKGGSITTLDLTSQVSGLTMDRAGLATVPAIRGITTLVATPGLDANVATYIDGVYSAQGSALVDLPDAAGVLVLKGPQGTLFGRNATGGAIQVTTLAPSFTPTGNATVSYGRFNDFSVRGFLSGPLVEDRLAGSIAFLHQTSDGYLRDIVANSRFGAVKAELLRGKLLFTPTENASLTLAAYYSYHRDPSSAGGTVINNVTAANLQTGAIVPSRPYEVAFNRPPTATSDGRGYSLNGEVRFDAGTLTVIAAHDENGTLSLNPAFSSFGPAGVNYFDTLITDETDSAEINFASRQYERFNYIVGLYYFKNAGAYDPLQIRNAPSTVISIFGEQTAEAYAAFGEVNVNLTDKLTLTAGARYSTEDRAITGVSCFCDVRTPPGPHTAFGDATFDSWTPRLSLRYALSDDANVYATFSQGFKSGGYTPSSVFGSVPPLRVLEPEEVTAYEVGIKSGWGDNFDFTAAAFYYDYSNQQVSSYVTVGGVTQAVNDNAAESTIYGAEFAGNLYVTEALSLHAGVALTHGRFDSYPAALVNVPNIVGGRPVGNVGVLRDVSGNALPRTPDWTASIGAEYETIVAGGNLNLKADLFRSDRYFFDAGNLYDQPAYTNLDASAAFSPGDGPWTFTVYGRNLTDAVKASGTFIAAPSSTYYWSPPRTYGVSITARF